MTDFLPAQPDRTPSASDPRYASLLLENQLCFPLYAAARKIIQNYTPVLNELDLSYTQYIVLMVLWESGQISLRDLGHRLLLDSGTLTPLLKNLESRGLVRRTRWAEDERVLITELTDEGWAMREKCLSVPLTVASCSKMDPSHAKALYELLWEIVKNNEL